MVNLEEKGVEKEQKYIVSSEEKKTRHSERGRRGREHKRNIKRGCIRKRVRMNVNKRMRKWWPKHGGHFYDSFFFYNIIFFFSLCF